MARRRAKHRTEAGVGNAQNGTAPGKPMDRSPKSMVIRMGAGDVGSSVSQLVKDVRLVMEPGTASRLKERRSNRLKDYITMAGPLGVTHLLLFSRSSSGNTNLRVAITPRGPTLHFRVENYSLCKDILNAQRHPKGSSLLYSSPPLLVMNNFNAVPTATDSSTPVDANPQVPKHLESLVTTIFQSIFPPLSPQSTPLMSIKRVLMLNREPPSDANNSAYTINLRHYAISTKVTGLPKPIRRLANAEKVKSNDRRGKGVPDLGQLGDVADYLLDPAAGNYTSGSESEPETDAEVEVLTTATKKIYHKSKQEKRRAANGETGLAGNARKGVEKRAVKLSELGPRMKLRLVKVEEGLCEGKVMWHEFIAKTKEEETNLDQIWEARRKEKEERKRIQKENVAKKRKDKAARGVKADGDEDEDEDEEMNDYEDWDSEELDDAADDMDEGP